MSANTPHDTDKLIIRQSEARPDDASFVHFDAFLKDTGEEVGFIEGYIERGHADIDEEEVYPEYRGRHFGSALFKHFVAEARLRGAAEISGAFANERTAHLIEALPAKRYDISKFNRLIPGMTVHEAVEALQKAREREKSQAGETEKLQEYFRITAYL